MAAERTQRRIPVWTCLVLVALASWARPARAQSPPLSVTLTGQTMIRSDLRSTAPAAVSTISALVGGSDVVMTNYEVVVAEPGQPNDDARVQGAGFLAPPGSLDAVKAMGFNLVSLSNNHSADLRVPGVLNTLKEVQRVGLPHSGTGENLTDATAPAYLETPHGRVALISMASGLIARDGRATDTRPGLNELRVGPGNVPNAEDTLRILKSIRDAATRSDLVIVYQHNHVFDEPFMTMFREGLPDRLRPPDWLKAWVHAEVDAGADLVVMHGAPVLHGIEIYRGKPIFYDLGNFMFNVPLTLWEIQEPLTWESVVPRLEFRGRSVQSIELRPVVLNYIGEGQPEAHDLYAGNRFMYTRGLPAAAEGERATYILQRMADLSEPFGTRIDVDGDVARVEIGGAP